MKEIAGKDDIHVFVGNVMVNIIQDLAKCRAFEVGKMKKTYLKEKRRRIPCPKCTKMMKRIEPYTYKCSCMPDLRLGVL